MTSDQRQLLDAILDNPDDDVARLVYADWLEEHGEEDYAELIRIQIEWASLDPYHRSCSSDKCPGCRGLAKREMTLRENWANLQVQMGRYFDWNQWHFEWDRGFLKRIRCTLAEFQTHGPAIVQEHPIREVKTEKEPYEYNGPYHGDGIAPNVYAWHRIDNGHPSNIHEEIFDCLSQAGNGVTIAGYTSPQAAQADLSQALIQWAKSQVQSISRTS